MTIKVYPPQYVEELEAELTRLREERDRWHGKAITKGQDREIARDNRGDLEAEVARLREEADHAYAEGVKHGRQDARKVYFPQEDVPKLLAERDRLRERLEEAEFADRVEYDDELAKLREENEVLVRQFDVSAQSYQAEVDRLRRQLADQQELLDQDEAELSKLREVEKEARAVAQAPYPDMRRLRRALEGRDE